jgi:hypothetical protein
MDVTRPITLVPLDRGDVTAIGIGWPAEGRIKSRLVGLMGVSSSDHGIVDFEDDSLDAVVSVEFFFVFAENEIFHT